MSKTQRNPDYIVKAFKSDSKRIGRGFLYSSFITQVLITFLLFSCTKFDVQDPDSITGYTWVDKAGASSAESSSSSTTVTSSMVALSNAGTSSDEQTLFSSVADVSSFMETSSSSFTHTSSVTTSSSSIAEGTSSITAALSSIAEGPSSITATSSSSGAVSSSSIATLNTQTCNYSASGIAHGSTGSLTCTDENKTYNTVVIGTQTWMADNLAWLPSVNEASSNSSTVVKYYVYGYSGTDVGAAKSENNYITYGVLYNFPAAIRACPTGWHLPTDAEWTTLENYLGTATVGTQLKSNSTLWKASVYAGTNTSHFSALPGGHYGNIEFADLGSYGVWWTATPMGSSNVQCRNMAYDYPGVNTASNSLSSAFSVRCLKDPK